VTDFEDPTALARCIKSDCSAYRAGNTPFCAEHLREQEKASPGISEPDVEERARAAGDAAMRDYHGPDPDMHLAVVPEPLAPETLEPHWDGTQWVLRPRVDPLRGYPQKIARIESLVRQLMAELDIVEADGG
jgi:hypothetical protein